VADEQQSGSEDVQLHAFTRLDSSPSIKPYITALEAFDALPQLQELKVLARQRTRIGDGTTVLDVGCGFGLESLRLARLVQPGGRIVGIDKSADFIAEAKGRATEAKLSIEFEVGDAQTLPFADASFDVARAERVLVYLPEPKRALEEMRRVTRPGGTVTAIEPDFGTNAINVEDARWRAAFSTMNATSTFRMVGLSATYADRWRTSGCETS
jgi:ubiquinone/menaquinone biosynthesis C-methylase UbiE